MSLRDWSSDVCSSDLGFPFQWVDHPATLEFFEFLSPLLVLPKRKALSNRILDRETENLNTLRSEERRVGKSVDIRGGSMIKKKKNNSIMYLFSKHECK